MAIQPIIAADVVRIRELAGRDQAGFALALGVSVRTVRSWETGSRIPNPMQAMLRATEAALLGGGALTFWARQLCKELRATSNRVTR